MAFGDFVTGQVASASLDFYSSSTSLSTGNMPSGATADNALVCWFFTGEDQPTQIDTSGWTLDVGGDGTELYFANPRYDSGLIGHKKAAGGEQEVTCSWSSGNEAVIVIMEWEGPINAAADATNYTTEASGTSQGSGSVTTTVADAMLFVNICERSNTAQGESWSDSFAAAQAGQYRSGSPPGTNGSKCLYAGYRVVTTTGTYSTTCSSINNTYQAGAIIALTKEAAGGTTKRYTLPLLGVG